jgi:hypothetical protein
LSGSPAKERPRAKGELPQKRVAKITVRALPERADPPLESRGGSMTKRIYGIRESLEHKGKGEGLKGAQKAGNATATLAP